MKGFITILSFTFCFLLANVTQAAPGVYKWVDENGVSHYGDEERLVQQKGAKPIQITTPKKIGSTAITPPKYTPKPINIRNNTNLQNINYILSVLSPTPDQVIRANNGVITVVTGINPRPKGDFPLKVFIDNSLYASANNTSPIDFEGVPRS